MPKDGPRRGFSERKAGFFSKFLKSLSKRDGGGCLAGARRHTGSRSHEDELAFSLGGVNGDFCLVTAVRDELIVCKTVFMGELVDRDERGLLRDFDISQHISP